MRATNKRRNIAISCDSRLEAEVDDSDDEGSAANARLGPAAQADQGWRLLNAAAFLDGSMPVPVLE